jgi:hypothetical protein
MAIIPYRTFQYKSWAPTVYPFPPRQQYRYAGPAVWTAGCIPFHSQQYRRAECIPFRSQQYRRAGCIPFHSQQYRYAECIPFHCHQYERALCTLSTTSNGNLQGVSHASLVGCKCSPFYLHTCFLNAGLSGQSGTRINKNVDAGMPMSSYKHYTIYIRVQRIWLFLENEKYRPFDVCKVEI